MLRRTAFVYITVLMVLFLFCPDIISGAGISDIVGQQEIENAAGLTAIRLVHKIEMLGGLKGTAEIIFSVPDKVYSNIDLGMLKYTQGFDGKTAWILDQNGQYMELTGAEKKQLINSAYLIGMSYMLNDRMPGKVEHYKDSLGEEVEYAIFTAYPENGDSLRLYFNKEKKRLEISQEWFDDLMIKTRLYDFRMVSGFEFPYMRKGVSNLRQLNSVFELVEIEINPTINPAKFKMGGKQNIDYYFPDSASSVTIPFRYNRHISLDGRVDGKKASFILDSGAGSIVLNKAFAEELGLETQGDLPSRGVAGYGSAMLAKIDSIDIGGIVLYNQIVGVVDLSNLGFSFEDAFGGVIGYDFLSRFPLKINYLTSELEIYNPKSFVPPDSASAVDFEFFMKIPLVEAKYGDKTGKFIIDLGSPFGLILHASFVEKNNLQQTFSNKKVMTGGIGGIGGLSGETYAVTGSAFSLGSIKLESIPLMVSRAETGIVESHIVDGSIGNLMLQKYTIIMDYLNKKIYILPPNI